MRKRVGKIESSQKTTEKSLLNSCLEFGSYMLNVLEHKILLWIRVESVITGKTASLPERVRKVICKSNTANLYSVSLPNICTYHS